jgi:tetratricopeptide (TPR) repeat protein
VKLARESIGLWNANSDPHEIIGTVLAVKGDKFRANKEFLLAAATGASKVNGPQDWGIYFMARKDYRRALEKFNEAERNHIESFLPSINRGRAYLAMGELVKANQAFKAIPKTIAESSEVRIAIGSAYLEFRRNQEALKSFQDALAAKENSAGYKNLAIAEYLLNRFKDGDRDFEKAVRRARRPVAVLRDWATHLAEQTRWQDAARIAHRAVQADPGDSHARADLAAYLLYSGDRPQAESELKRAAETALYPPAIYRRYADALSELGLDNQAIEKLRIALNSDPDNAELITLFAKSLFKTGQKDQANRQMERAAKLAVAPAVAHTQWGEMLLDNGEFAEAEKHFREAATIWPVLIDAHRGLVRSLAQQHKYEAAGAAVQKAVAANPSDPEAYFLKTTLFDLQDRLAEEAQECDRIASRFPWLAEPQILKGESLLFADPNADVKAIFNNGIDVEPENISSYTRAASALAGAERFDEAIAYCDRALAVDPNLSEALQIKAESIARLDGVSEKASQLFQSAINKGSDQASMLYRRAMMLREAKMFPDVHRDFAAARAIRPWETIYYVNEAKIYLEEEKEAESIEFIEDARRRGLDSALLKSTLAESYCRKQEFSTAFQFFQLAESDMPIEPNFQASFAGCYMWNNNFKDASSHFRKALGWSEDFLPWYGKITRTFPTRERADSAASVFEAYLEFLDPDVQKLLRERIKRARDFAYEVQMRRAAK